MTEPNAFTDILCFLSFHFRRLACFILGCKLEWWSENEYVNGEYCVRCSAAESQAEGDTPHKIIYRKWNSR